MDIIFTLASIAAFSYCLLFSLKAFGIDLSIFSPKPEYKVYLNNQQILSTNNPKDIYITHKIQEIKEEVKLKNKPLKFKMTTPNDLPLNKIFNKNKKFKINSNIFD